jgi:hypothetical protein
MLIDCKVYNKTNIWRVTAMLKVASPGDHPTYSRCAAPKTELFERLFMLLLRALTPADMQAAAPGKAHPALPPSEEYIKAALDAMAALLSPIAKCVV